MSALDDYFRLLQLRCRVYHNQQVCGDFLLSEHEVGQTCFHLVSHGECRLQVGSQQDWLQQGDVVLFPREIPHRLVPTLATTSPVQRLPVSAGWLDGGTGLLCASIHFEHKASEQLLDAWPDYLIVRHDDRSAVWLAPLLEQLVAVSQEAGPGSEAVVDRLAEILFMQVVRHYLREAVPAAGFLSLYGHPALSLSIKAFHGDPGGDWSLAKAAEQAHMSRASFARQFRATSGLTWQSYQTWWRMQLAWSALTAGDSVLHVAQQVGYHSEAAFSRAFRRQFGRYAGELRRSARKTR